MKAFLLDSRESAQICRHMIRLNGDCASLSWSRSIPNIPQNVRNALETVHDFLEGQLQATCTDDIQQAELSTAQEEVLFAICRKSLKLKQILGSGVVLAGDEASEIISELSDISELGIIKKLLESGKNLVLL